MVLILLVSCSEPTRSKEVRGEAAETVRTTDFEVGDCFLFRDSLREFGVVLFENRYFPDGQQYYLFPVKLSLESKGIEKLTRGQVFVSSFPDMTAPERRTEGFMGFVFVHEHNFESLKKYFRHYGSVAVKKKYLNRTGGTSAASLADFRFQLRNWEKVFKNNGIKVYLESILE